MTERHATKYRFPNVRTYPDTRTTKNARIEVRDDGDIDGLGMFVVNVSAEKFTGGRWFDTFATHEFYSARQAFDCAWDHSKYFHAITDAR